MEIKLTVNIPGLGKTIKQARECKRLSQNDLAQLMKLSGARISELENEAEGKSTISLEQLISLEKHLNAKLVPFTLLMKAVIENYENVTG